jgi:hypothetical protein
MMTPPPAQLTPKDLADAIGVSESSLRRWIDGGDVRVSRTMGGHRRIPLPEAIRFIRKIGASVVRPDLLGLQTLEPLNQGQTADLTDEERLFETLRRGQRHAARGSLLSWYLRGQSLGSLFDGPVRGALQRLGELWQHDPRGILIEHHATEICVEAVALLRSLLPAPAEGAPLALGGAPSDDPYRLPTMMAGTVLAEAGFREVDFGPNTPVKLLAAEALERRAKLVWLSISTDDQGPKALRGAIARLAAVLLEHRIDLVVGGRCHRPYVPTGLKRVSTVGSMSELAAYARGIVSAKATTRP